MLKKIFIIFILTLNINSVFATEVEPKPNSGFRDVGGDYVYYDAIAYVKYMSIVKGYSDGTFRPAKPINRAEFTKIIMSSIYSPGTINKCDVSKLKFSDVPKNSWFAPFVCLAVEKGIINGYPDNTFRPSWNIQFTEGAKIVASAFDLPIGTSNIWYAPYIQALSNASAIPPSIKGLTHRVSRSEMAEMIFRLKKKIDTKSTSKFLEVTKQSPQITKPKVVKPSQKKTEHILYNDGWYMVATEFLIKSGKKVRIAVEVTIEKDLIKELKINPRSGDPASFSYVQIFDKDIQPSVLEKHIDDVQLPQVNNATSIGAALMSALVDIRNKARK